MDKKERTNDPLDLDDGDGRLQLAGDLPKEKDQGQWEKKIRSVSNEDGDVALHNMGGDGNIGKKDKKRKKESTEDNHLYSEKAQIEGNEPDCHPGSRKEKKRKHGVHGKEHGNNNAHEIYKGDMISDEVVHGKEQGSVDCHPKSRKEKKRKHKVHGNDNVSMSHEISKAENVVPDGVENVASDVVVHGEEQDPAEHVAVDEPDCDPKSREEKRKHEVHEKELGNVPTSHEISNGENVVSDEVVHSKSSLNEDTSKMISGIVGADKKNTQRGGNEREMKKIDDAKATETSREYSAQESFEKVDKKKTTKMKKTDKDRNLDSGVMTEESGKGCSTSQGQESVASESGNKSIIKTPDSEGKKEKSDVLVKGKSKKVSFSGKVEVFPSSDTDHKNQKTQEDKLVRGKRFTPQEDELIKAAVLNYIKRHNLGEEEEGLKMVLNCHSYPKLKNCWKEIGTCIPYRPFTTIYYRAHNLFERADKRGWTEQETEFLRKSYEKHGNNWKMVAEELGKHRVHVKDKWRRIKLSNKKAGKWSQEEYQSLHDLVNLDLKMKVVSSKEKETKHGMLRDNIRWGAISDKLSTRSDFTCCQKWYNQLTSSLVAEDKWSNADDYRLISALYDLDAACVEDVDWDGLLDHRPGDVCRKRWDQMVLHIGHHGSQPFSEQVEILSKRYCPDLAEIREAWDGKPLAQ